jgi:hypothetical protein
MYVYIIPSAYGRAYELEERISPCVELRGMVAEGCYDVPLLLCNIVYF